MIAGSIMWAQENEDVENVGEIITKVGFGFSGLYTLLFLAVWCCDGG
ncbi:hypothetical protein [Sicyoidochytrium minutum DNA virus]|nr:hypothetical protein [Sicyoidochytrium minutum DNA virus]BDC17051.1 hypothetical protein [Sicyoidochytrium minutum DNA virus]